MSDKIAISQVNGQIGNRVRFSNEHDGDLNRSRNKPLHQVQIPLTSSHNRSEHVEGITSQAASVDYFQLLTIQLQNQDPINPVDQEGVINDLTQFSILEGIENLNGAFEQFMQLEELSQGVNLIGKNVEFRNSNTGALTSGTASDILNIDGKIQVLVDGQSVPLDNVTRISEAV
jgi:flagellar basal-body rod modification protein FlgD